MKDLAETLCRVLGGDRNAYSEIVVAYQDMLLAYAASIVFRSAAAGVAVGVGTTLLQVIGIGILFNAGGFWATIAHHLPLEYTQNLVGNVAAPAFLPGSPLSRVNPTDPSIGQSIIALGVMMAALLAVTFISVRERDVTA